MQILDVSRHTAAGLQNNRSSATRCQENFAAILDNELHSEVKNQGSIWNQLAQQYDIHNATFAELKTIASELYQAGQIDLKHLGILTLDLTPLARELGFSPENQFLTRNLGFGRRDWIAEWTARAEQELKWGNTKGYQGCMECVEILRRLERSRKE